ncbi:MAG TPA: lactate utilization protein [Bryobacteraceae bacterium]|nr:lactate utilization protein [Bryobacteraceae bacterium]
MSAREAVLGRIRSALGRKPGQAPAHLPPVRLSAHPSEPEVRLNTFFLSIEKLAGKTYHASSREDACRHVAMLLAGRTAIASNAELLTRCGIAALHGVRSGITGKAELRDLCASLDAGITSADYALGDTGTLVMLSSPQEARMISLLPPLHIAVVERSRILSGLDELFTILPKPADLTSSMVLITGPSRTGDIEQILIRGVHGPGEIHVIVI